MTPKSGARAISLTSESSDPQLSWRAIFCDHCQ
jgi:hypothetical protein